MDEPAAGDNHCIDVHIGLPALRLWRNGIPPTNAHVSALGMAACYRALAQGTPLSRNIGHRIGYAYVMNRSVRSR